jgi:glycosyltransferase involved in cell wall biosynthesis
MRIAYVAPYQGVGLLNRRPTLLNLGLAANLKIELIAELLQRNGHRVDVLSQGEVVERQLKYYPAFSEPEPFNATIPVHYASALPIKAVNGAWSALRTLALLRKHHRDAPYDLVIIYNLKLPQVACAHYAMRRLKVPVILEYEDDAFVDLSGKDQQGLSNRVNLRLAREAVDGVSGGIGVSPHLLSRMSASIPQLLVRGVVSDDVTRLSGDGSVTRKKWVAFSGTHSRSKGLEPLVRAWKMVDLPGWELHIAGRGEQTAMLEEMAAGTPGIVFHGVLNRQENARFLAAAEIGINPHDVSETPGNVFAFKIIEYLAAGAHVITTPMGYLEPELEAGITYAPDNTPATIASALTRVITSREYERRATEAAQRLYGSSGLASSLDRLVTNVVGDVRNGNGGAVRSR